MQTIELFGYDQAVAAATEFQRVFQMLSENPELGEVRQDISTPGKSFRLWTVLGRFVIVYEDADDLLSIVRIVDGARDLSSLMGEGE